MRPIRPMADINITPLVDVVLVLLVVFMITAPLLLNGIELNLPQTKEVNRMNLSLGQVVLSMTKTGDLYLGAQRILRTELATALQEEMQHKQAKVLYLRADFGLRYGQVAELMSFLKRQGINQISLVTELEAEKKQK